MTRPRVLVVAQHEEDVGWLQDLPNGWTSRVVRKDRDIPNRGREASSYLWWLATEEIDPAGTYGFLQGRPWDHGFGWSDLRDVERFTPIGDRELIDDGNGYPNHVGVPMDDAYAGWLGREPLGCYTFVGGAQFLAPGWLLLSRPREDYDRLRSLVEEHRLGPWVMERLWGYLWQDDGRTSSR